jgi:hypothetical protein
MVIICAHVTQTIHACVYYDTTAQISKLQTTQCVNVLYRCGQVAQSVWLKPCIDYYLCFACIEHRFLSKWDFEQRYYVSVVPKSEEVKVTKPRQTSLSDYF